MNIAKMIEAIVTEINKRTGDTIDMSLLKNGEAYIEIVYSESRNNSHFVYSPERTICVYDGSGVYAYRDGKMYEFSEEDDNE